MEENWGEYRSADQVLLFSSAMNESRLLEVLLHELGHAIWDIWCIGNADPNEEHVIRSMGMGWATVYQDNPKLIKVIDKLCTNIARKKIKN